VGSNAKASREKKHFTCRSNEQQDEERGFEEKETAESERGLLGIVRRKHWKADDP